MVRKVLLRLDLRTFLVALALLARKGDLHDGLVGSGMSHLSCILHRIRAQCMSQSPCRPLCP
jgi:hypothetical protein